MYPQDPNQPHNQPLNQNNGQTPQPPSPQPEQQTPQPWQPNANNYNQPQPLQTPQPPIPPTQPHAFGSFNSNQSNNKKKLFIGIAAVLVILAITIGGFFLFRSLTTLQIEDYDAANEKIQDAQTALSKINSVYISQYDTETKLKNELDTFKKYREDLDTNIAELADLKAIKRDGDFKKAYEDLISKKEKFDIFYDTQVEVYEKVMPVVLNMDLVSATLTKEQAVQKIRSAKNDFSKIKGLESDINKEYVDQMIIQLGNMEKASVRIASSQQYNSSDYNDLRDALSKITDAGTDWDSNLSKLGENGNIRDELNDLSDIYYEKVRDLY